MLPCITENCEMKNCADCVIENAQGKRGDPKGDLGGGCEYSKFAEFYADFKSVEIIDKKSTQKKLFAKHFCNLVV
jgi:hypothetical protein